MSTASVEIILPVYNASRDLLSCLDALVDRLPAWASVQIVDDASSDPGVAALLRSHSIVRLPRVRVYRNLANLGFVRSVNAAVARTSIDFVLLNSDTVVTHGWLEQIRACADSDPTIATVTPWSNNAEICSFPLFCRNCPVPTALDELAAAAGRVNGSLQDIPTGVGFCMFVRRSTWSQIGGFDAQTFGRGYGEENDFCQRAASGGWRNVMCHRAYVAHVGGASFAALGLRPGGESLKRLTALHPTYEAQIAAFITADPLAALRDRFLAQLSEDGWAADAIEALYPCPD